jgi:hypothetical protein
MTAYLMCKILVALLAFLFCAIPAEASFAWALSSLIISALFFVQIPPSGRKALFMLIPLAVSIAALQTASAIIAQIGFGFVAIGITAFKIVCTGCILISVRFFIGIEALKWLSHSLPRTGGLFLLIFSRTLYTMFRLNRLIVFQLASRLNLSTKEKYYIPKYYSVAMLYNQFYSMHRYRNGLLSRSIHSIPEPEIRESMPSKERMAIFGVIIIVALNIIQT